MLGVGIDWAEEIHLVGLGRPDEGDRVPPGGAHPSRRGRAGDPHRHPGARPGRGPGGDRDPPRAAVERLVDAGYVVVPVNHDLIARRRGPARKKDDAAACIACLLALDRHVMLRPLIPHGRLAGELRAIARDDERAARDQRRLLNRLRAGAGPRQPPGWVLRPPRATGRRRPRCAGQADRPPARALTGVDGWPLHRRARADQPIQNPQVPDQVGRLPTPRPAASVSHQQQAPTVAAATRPLMGDDDG